MPIEIDAFRPLSNPLLAFCVGLVFVFAAAGFLCALVHKWDPVQRRRYTKKLALCAELLVSVGVVGLVTFAARTKIDWDVRTSERTAQGQKRQLNGEMWEFARKNCLKQLPTPPTIAIADHLKGCGWWPNMFKRLDEFVDWWSARDMFSRLAAAASSDKTAALQCSALSDRLKAVIAADNEAEMD